MARRRKRYAVGEPLFGEDWWQEDQRLFADAVTRTVLQVPRRAPKAASLPKRGSEPIPQYVQDMLPGFGEQQGAAADEPVRGDGPQALGDGGCRAGSRRSRTRRRSSPAWASEAEQRITALAWELAGDDPPGEGYLDKVGRLGEARHRAEQIVLDEMILLPIRNREPDQDQPAVAVLPPRRPGRPGPVGCGQPGPRQPRRAVGPARPLQREQPAARRRPSRTCWPAGRGGARCRRCSTTARAEFAWAREQLAVLLSPAELAAARRNTLNAHYTDAALVRAMWRAVRALGFERGRVLEPGCGSGNFLAFAPDGRPGDRDRAGPGDGGHRGPALPAGRDPRRVVRRQPRRRGQLRPGDRQRAVRQHGAARPPPQPGRAQHPQPLHRQGAAPGPAGRPGGGAHLPVHDGRPEPGRAAGDRLAGRPASARSACPAAPTSAPRAPASSPTCSSCAAANQAGRPTRPPGRRPGTPSWTASRCRSTSTSWTTRTRCSARWEPSTAPTGLTTWWSARPRRHDRRALPPPLDRPDCSLGPATWPRLPASGPRREATRSADAELRGPPSPTGTCGPGRTARSPASSSALNCRMTFRPPGRRAARPARRCETRAGPAGGRGGLAGGHARDRRAAGRL